ncbi:MAG: hypothetical protein HYS17_11680 [Micavibrio aeruginosavorus]|uniref:Glutamine amidotransferase domain-containing protein n=1 Tax=Micavibrio aeruginosavorus TaxID=349221 RepID=A0A7T5R2A3_9BACT|nr:MAG: hypothetical protein HYS17_11680 [Micavibrio aeruginosavorus]
MSSRRSLASHFAAAALAFGVAQGALAQTAPTAPAASAPTAATPAQAIVTQRSFSSFDPHLPPGAIGGLGALYLAFCLYAWRRGPKGALPRAFAGAVLLYGLANHQKITEEREALPTEVLVLSDESPSQSLGDRARTTQAARESLIAGLKNIPGVNIRSVRAGGEKDGIAPDGTRILSAIDDHLSDVPRSRVGGVFILSDGQVHDSTVSTFNAGEGVPVHALISGRSGEHDRRVVIEEISRFGIVNKKQDIKFRVVDDGAMPRQGAPVSVTIHHDGKLVETRQVKPGESVSASLNIPHAGPNVIEIKTADVEGEVTSVNNRAAASVEGIHEKLSVLIISGSPTQNTRMWRGLLKSDPDVDPVHFMVQRFPEQLDDIPREEFSLVPFPMNEVFAENLKKFNLVIFDGYENRHLLPSVYIENIARYVKEGGALLVMSGPEYAGPHSLYNTALGPILPAMPNGQVTEKAYTPRISERGHRHPAMRGLEGANRPGDAKSAPAWGSWHRAIDVTGPQGEIVMEGPDKKPLLILSRHEQGRVAMLQSDSLWRWQRDFEKPGPYASMLLQTAHWLMKNPALDEEALRLAHEQKNLVVSQQTMADKSTPVTVTTPSGKTMNVTPEAGEPGIWRAKVPANEMGLYRAEQGGKNARIAYINVGPANPREFIGTVSTTDILKPLADRSGGVAARMTDTTGALALPRLQPVAAGEKPAAGRDSLTVRMTNESVLRGIDKKPFVPNWALMLAFFTAMAAAYWRQSEKPFFGRKDKAATPGGPA